MDGLIRLLENATGGSRDLDVSVARALGADAKYHTTIGFKMRNCPWVGYDTSRWVSLPYFTSSVDDALTSLPDGISVLDLTLSWDTTAERGHPAISVRWYDAGRSGKDWRALVVSSKTIPLTVCLAAMTLRVQAAKAAA